MSADAPDRSSNLRRRLVWRCRRGMKELDVLLEPFAAGGLPSVSDEELPALAEMLEATDAELLDWFMDAQTPSDPTWASLAARVRGKR